MAFPVFPTEIERSKNQQQVEVTFLPVGEGEVEAHLDHSLLKTEKDMEDMQTDWSWALASFKAYLEPGKPVPCEERLKEEG
ncbi:MAG: hypothetical protein A2032_00710 [Chloroflexi bacterium RBG_19FT_COMBO_49_13]|nr:MAG: hypothetical protein A2032_00710 [Chloroflexi bacterium RBG_19FT_COMBO_49_13]